MQEQEKIDFVLIWVDGNDPGWRKTFLEYLPESKRKDDARDVRYRDWELLRYWFRGVEKFAPWVNRVHFITCGHHPEWLNLNHPRLNFVRHSDYIPQEDLPTFSANPIELNLHRIKGLSERFVFFNDDFFLVDSVKPERFFVNGKPCDMAVMDTIACGCSDIFPHLILNNVQLINQCFCKFNVLKSNASKWFNIRYGTDLLRTLALLPWPYFTGFRNYHLPCALLKTTMEDVWSKYGDLLSETSASKFRSINDCTHWLFRYWQLVKGNFQPINVKSDSVYCEIAEDTLTYIEDIIVNQKKKIVVLNDVENDRAIPFELCKERIQNAFNKILAAPSSFEM